MRRQTGRMRGAFFPLAVIALTAILGYGNSLDVPFVLDDYRSIVRNDVVRDLAGFLSGAGYDYNPRRFIGYLTIALNFRLGGLDVTGYHLFNLAVHLVTGWLVYALGTVTFRTPFFSSGARPLQAPSPLMGEGMGEGDAIAAGRDLIALFAALLFVAHPVQTQAVTYVIQRVASLCTMFYLLSLLLYARARVSGRMSAALPLYLGSLASALLAVKTKEIAFTLPLALALYELLFFRMSAAKRLILLSPVLMSAALVPMAVIGSGRSFAELLSDVAQRTRVDSALPRLDYLYTQFRVLATYLRLLVFPSGQNLDYDYPVYRSLFSPPVFLSLSLHLSLLLLALYLVRRTRPADFGAGGVSTSAPLPELRLVSFGILWFYLTLSVESSFIPIADVIFEHRLYLATPGAFLAFSALLFSLSRALPRKAVVTAAGGAVALLALLTHARNELWSDPVALARDVVAKSPGKARPHYNLAEVLSRAGWTREALREAAVAARIEPRRAEPHTLMGTLYCSSGRYREAIGELSQAVAIEPRYASARSLLGDALARSGMQREALEQYQEALGLDPGDPELYNRMGLVHLALAQPERAASCFASALRLNPRSVAYRSNLARARGSL